ncbi:MAG: DUF4446 family protein [Tissierellaceae bacterium]
MENIIEYIASNMSEIVIALFIGMLALLILFLINLSKTNRAIKRYNQLVNGISEIDIEELLMKINKDINDMNRDISVMEQNIADVKTKLAFAIQKVGFIRYNAFDDMGSQLSFSIALLDAFKNGFVITSIYGRENVVSYGKPIKDGTSNIPLSAEEMIAIDRALRGEYVK